MTRIWLAISLAVLAASSATAAPDLYHRKPQQGWWWYEDPPTKLEEKPAETPAFPAYTPEQMETMETDRLKEYAYQVLKEAVRVPSEENVRRHYLVQDVIRRKAMAFTNTSALVWQKYPELSTVKDVPIVAPGRRAVTRERSEERLRALNEARENFALLYFRSDDCPFCIEQDGILDYLHGRIGWDIEPLDLAQSQILADQLGVQTTPSLVLVQKGNREFFPVSAGVTSGEEIETRLFRAVRVLTGAVTPESFTLYDFQRGGGLDAAIQNHH